MKYLLLMLALSGCVNEDDKAEARMKCAHYCSSIPGAESWAMQNNTLQCICSGKVTVR